MKADEVNFERKDYETGVQIQDEMELRIWLRLLTCSNLLDTEVRTRLKQTAGTTLPRFDILAQLERHKGPMSMGELSKRLMVTNGNVTGLVERLASEGMVERAPAPRSMIPMPSRLCGEETRAREKRGRGGKGRRSGVR